MKRDHWTLIISVLFVVAAALPAVLQLWRDVLRPLPKIVIAGREETVFDWSESACETVDIPDAPARAFRDGTGVVSLIASHWVTRRMTGPDLDHLTRDCSVIMASHGDADPARFDDREWVHSTYAVDGTTVVALVHNEYQGHTHAGRCPSQSYQRCWYNAIALAVSRDGGASFTHAAAPDHLVASIPYRYTPDAGPVGIFNPSNIVRHPADGFYYALLHVEPYGEQPWGTCVMRTRNLTDPGSWRAWNGTDFIIRFINPYAAEGTAARVHICQPVARAQIGGMSFSLSYNTHLDRFVLVGAAERQRGSGEGGTWAIQYAFSDDLVHWTPAQVLLSGAHPVTNQCEQPFARNYPAILDLASPSANFETSGRRAYLYFTRMNYAACERTFDRDLVRVPIEFGQ